MTPDNPIAGEKISPHLGRRDLLKGALGLGILGTATGPSVTAENKSAADIITRE